MILSPGTLVRVGLLGLACVILELSAFGQLRILAAQPDLIPLVVAAAALYGGSMAGCSTGFALGFILDLAVGQTMGVSSLVLTAVGYWIGRYREIRDPANELTPIPVGAAATLGWAVTFAAVSFMLDIGATVSPLLIRDVLATVALNAIIALPVFWFCRRVLRPSLIVDPRDVRRRRQPPREAGPLGLRGMEV